ncbi:sensor histidine kinase [Sphaerimonospora sp. CA-214678]|uniref:sensor histidine kinase n=1 Tax=Sphaerimonospora sp. CA-214678 TaxID=3240029 RepID=UPI003D8ECABB
MRTWHRCSIRTRLTVLACTTMTLICTVITLLVIGGTRAEAIRSQQEEIVAQVGRIVDGVSRQGPPPALPEAPDSAVQLFSPERELVAATGNAANMPPMVSLDPEPSDFTTHEVCDLPPFPDRCAVLFDRPVRLPEGTWRLYVATPRPPPYGSTALLGGLVAGSLLAVTATAFGTYHTVSGTLRPVRTIRGELAAVTGRDLDRRVPVPKYEDELKDLTQTINQTLERAQKAVDQQLKFASDASHDLRSPLTAMHVEIEEALVHPPGTDWPRMGRALLGSVERLQNLVSDLLQISRLDAGACGRREPVDLAELVREELDRRPRDVELLRRLTPGATIDGDRIGLARLLVNLLDNAERHAGSTVVVTVESRPGAAVLEVADDGEGVPPDMREVVFQRFARLDAARAKDAGGTGLGLPIARQIAEVHGGTLTIEDGLAGGAKFVLCLPRPTP